MRRAVALSAFQWVIIEKKPYKAAVCRKPSSSPTGCNFALIALLLQNCIYVMSWLIASSLTRPGRVGRTARRRLGRHRVDHITSIAACQGERVRSEHTASAQLSTRSGTFDLAAVQATSSRAGTFSYNF